jgi:hypothetical protein
MSQIIDGIAATASLAVATDTAPRSVAASHPASIVASTVSVSELPMTHAELLHALQNASDNIMRLAGQVRASAPDAVEARADELAMARERALAHTIIDRLLALPAAPVHH